MADFESDVPPVVPGATVYIQLKHRSVRSAETGEIIAHVPAEPTPMIVKDSDECFPENWHEYYETKEEALHCFTICQRCIHEWGMDYYIDLPTTIPKNFGESNGNG